MKKFDQRKEYAFHYDKGKFTGFIEYTDYSGMLAVRLTSPAYGAMKLSSASYVPGDLKIINPKKYQIVATGKLRQFATRSRKNLQYD